MAPNVRVRCAYNVAVIVGHNGKHRTLSEWPKIVASVQSHSLTLSKVTSLEFL